MLADYDAAAALERIENELIDSMMRNLQRHLKEEEDRGFDWSQWQTEQLRYLEEFRKKNAKTYGPQFASINRRIKNAITHARANGQKEEELRILKNLVAHPELRNRLRKSGGAEAKGGSFFKVNEKKFNALVKATTDDMTKAEYAVLRRCNDQYRKIIFDAQVYANTGAGTIEKAIDMATHDFLMRGIDCIVYKNGARHSISDYADMAIRTAERRATLMGAGEKRQEWGESLVIVNRRGSMTPGHYGSACPLCIPWLGKVLVDDVYSGGKPDGKHQLVSTAMQQGFLHPRCKDTFTTYFPGISSAPDPVTKKELEAGAEEEKQKARRQYAERQAERQDRLAENSMDPENRITARHRANRWKEEAAPFKPAETIEEAQEYAQQFCKKPLFGKTFKGQVDFKGISLEHANAINRSLTDVYGKFPDLEKLSGIKVVAPGSAQGKKAFPSGSDALFSYSPVEHGIFINKDLLKNPKALDEYMQRSKESWDLVMNNMDKLSGKQRELAERYAKAGRDLVSGDTVEGLFTHELGHHVQWTMLDPKTTNALAARRGQFAPSLSGYATASNSEYLAESFAAYMKGETDLLDPEYVQFLNAKIPGEGAVANNIATEAVKTFKAVNEELVYNTMLQEYDSWVAMLTDDEIKAILKYTENDVQEKWPKFYAKLNAMLRGDAPYDERLQQYADLISGALKKKPLENDIICTRRVSVNPFEGHAVRAVVPIKQFFSTSLFSEAAMKGDYEITLLVRRGVRGAFLDERVSRHPEQLEFLIDKDCEYLIQSIQGNKIVVEVLPS